MSRRTTLYASVEHKGDAHEAARTWYRIGIALIPGNLVHQERPA
jgi:hypothetical protein